MPKDFEPTGVLDHIAGLSSAEDIFTYLLMPWEQEVLNVSRLHVMKRFGAYLREADLGAMSENERFIEARALLKKAYMDFVDSTPMQEKVFKVFHDEAAKLKAKFVSIEGVGLPAAE